VTSNAGQLGTDTATRMITKQLDAGMTTDAIQRHHEDMTASVQSEAISPEARSFAREYGDTSAALVRDLQEDAACAERERENRDCPSTWPEYPMPDPHLHPHPLVRQADREAG
jgi:hypothetical protein